MRTQISKFALTAALGLALALTFSCSSGGGNDPSGSSSPSGGGGIVNAENEAWTVNDNRGCLAHIFKQNGEYIKLECDNDRNWCIDGVYPYSISGNQITINDIVMTFSISGNILTESFYEDGRYQSLSFTKTSGINIVGDCNW
ncbi:MAG: hypothetical protein LBC64_05030 [Fibromonadaceae bacterium]|jgi:hypothetical protein|nr:hypothetical protein [Fibromonadaceae bacterium]